MHAALRIADVSGIACIAWTIATDSIAERLLAGPQFEGGRRLAPHEMQQEPLLFKGLGIKELHCLQFAVNALQALLL